MIFISSGIWTSSVTKVFGAVISGIMKGVFIEAVGARGGMGAGATATWPALESPCGPPV
jgi:hypothetical protein